MVSEPLKGHCNPSCPPHQSLSHPSHLQHCSLLRPYWAITTLPALFTWPYPTSLRAATLCSLGHIGPLCPNFPSLYLPFGATPNPTVPLSSCGFCDPFLWCFPVDETPSEVLSLYSGFCLSGLSQAKLWPLLSAWKPTELLVSFLLPLSHPWDVFYKTSSLSIWYWISLHLFTFAIKFGLNIP